MKIPTEFLSETNYEGTRLIEITDDTVLDLTKQLNELQQEANPFLEKMEDITPKLDPLYAKIQALEEDKKALREEVAPIRAEYDVEAEKVELIDQRATLIKNKITPMVLELVKGELGEFEVPLHTVHRDGKLFVEVRDELEEKIKQMRTKNATAK